MKIDIEKIKEQLSKVKENPEVLFGGIYIYILFVIVAVGIFYLGNLNNISRQSTPPDISQVKEVTDLSLKEPRSVPPIDILKMSKPTDELIAKGKTIFSNICSTCHGIEGAGAGPGAVGLNPAPRNFTQNEGWINGRTISGMFTTLEDGIPNSAMVAYDYLTPEDKLSVIHYIRTSFMKDPPVDSDSDLEGLDQLYNLSAGVELPGQIPIENAEELIIKQSESKTKRVEKAFSLITKESNSGSVKLLTGVTGDLKSALSSLVNSNSWRNSESAFIDFVTINVNQNGFNGDVFNLSSTEWNTLYNYLTKII